MLGDINILMTQRYPSVILAGGDRFVNNTTPSLSAFTHTDVQIIH